MYSICGLAMRLRELYKWEKGLMFWEEQEPQKVLEWISEKEEYWDQISHMSYKDIELEGRTYSPLDSQELNRILNPMGLCYGGGLGEGINPTFFLGNIAEVREIGKCTVIVLGEEFARDLMASPALSKDNLVFIRKQVLIPFLWNELLFATGFEQKMFLIKLKEHGIDTWDLGLIKSKMYQICEGALDSFIYHEIGEIYDEAFNKDMFKEFIKGFQRTIVEYTLRALKDLFADTNQLGRFARFIELRDKGSIAFSLALLDYIRKNLYEEFINAFLHNNHWSQLSEALITLREKGYRIRDKLLEILTNGHGIPLDIILQKVKEEVLIPENLLTKAHK